jgi:hypothetical protein
VHEESVWAVLAAMALHAQQLDVAEQALAAIDEVDKLSYIQYIKSLPSAEARTAELLLYRRQLDQAESTLIQADMVWRAILMNVGLFRWQRALDLAFKYKTHVDTVLAYRARWLQQSGKHENEERWAKLAKEVPVDWEAIQTKIAAEVKKEEARGQPLQSAIPIFPDILATYEKRTGSKINAAAAPSGDAPAAQTFGSPVAGAAALASAAAAAAPDSGLGGGLGGDDHGGFGPQD